MKKQKRLEWRKEDILRWKKRAELFEKTESEEKQLVEEPEQPQESLEPTSVLQTITDFTTVQKQCEQDGVLLLPQVTCPSPTVVPNGDSKTLHNTIRLCIGDRDKALSDALHYRNLAERLHVEKLEIKMRMNKRIETVRDFWRNQILEGQSRSGRIVKAACKKQ